MTQFVLTDTGANAYPFNIYTLAIADVIGTRDAFNPLYNELLQAVLHSAGTVAQSAALPDSVTANVGVSALNSDTGGIYWQVVSGKVQGADTLSYNDGKFVGELVIPFDVVDLLGFSNWILSDLTTINAVPQSYYARLVSEILTAKAALFSLEAYLISELSRVNGTLTNAQKLQIVQTAVVRLSAGIVTSLSDAIFEHIQAGATTAFTVRRLLALVEKLVTTGLVESRFVAMSLLQEAIHVAYLLSSGKGADVLETVAIHAIQSVIFGISGFASSGMILSASATPQLQLVLSAADGVMLPDVLSDPQQLLQLLASEDIVVRIGYNANDGSWTGWVMNTQVGAVTNYSGWGFNSFGTFYGQNLAASDSGLFKLGGSTDNGAAIQAQVTLATSDFDDSRLKRLGYAYLGVDAAGQLFFIVTPDDGIQRVYSVVTNAPGVHTERVGMARGIKSRYWSFQLQSVNGAAFRLDQLEVIPVLLNRRV